MWPALIAAGAQIVGGLIGSKGQKDTNSANAAQVAQTNQFNAQQAELNRQFQERMSDTQYQRAVDDMRAAGLNPALAYQQGGAGTPTGSTASGTAARLDNPVAPIAAGIQTAGGALAQAVNYAEAKSRIALNQASAYETAMKGSLAALDQSRLSDSDIQQTLKDTLKAQLRSIQTNAMESSSRIALNQQEFAQKRLPDDYQKLWAPWMNTAKDVGRTLQEFIPRFRLSFNHESRSNTFNGGKPE